MRINIQHRRQGLCGKIPVSSFLISSIHNLNIGRVHAAHFKKVFREFGISLPNLDLALVLEKSLKVLENLALVLAFPSAPRNKAIRLV